MKLTDILREIEGEEDGMQQVKVRYDLAVEPANLDKALAALNDPKTYGQSQSGQSHRNPDTHGQPFQKTHGSAPASRHTPLLGPVQRSCSSVYPRLVV